MWKAFIAGNELIGQCISGSITEELNKQNNKFSITCKNIQSTHHYQTCDVLIGNENIASGMVIDQSFSDAGYKQAKIQAVDYNFIFQKRVVLETYYNMTVSDIVRDLIQKYASEFTCLNLRDCNKLVEKFQCDYITLSDAIKKILDYVPDWHYFIDANKDFHLFENYETTGITFENNIIDRTFSVNYDATESVNRVWIVGSKQSAPEAIQQYFTCDGKQRYFLLAYEPNYTKIYLDDTLKESNLESNDDGAQDFLISKSNKIIYIPDNITTPFVGELKVEYKPTVQIIDYFEDNKTTNPFLLEKVIKNKDITDKMSARQVGRAEVKQAGLDKYVSFKSRDRARRGQRCYVKQTEFDIDGYCLVYKVAMDLRANNDIVYSYKMRVL